jgi:ATP-binding cassette subfamily F protein uup
MKVLMQNPNFLILDEPTNDLDIDTLNVLEEFLENFPGVLILVSHDRYLLDKMSEQLFIMEGTGEVTIYNGNYSEYRISLDTAKEKPDTRKKESPVQAEIPQKKLTYKEQKELEELEVLIPETEEQIKNLTRSMLEIESSNYLEIQNVSNEIDVLKERLDQATIRWLELSEK